MHNAHSAHSIRIAISEVIALRRSASTEPALQAAAQSIKQLQSQRFAAHYRDLLASPMYGTAARFFLTELYADKDFSQRDQQFARIADTVEKLFPKTVVHTSQALAELHLLSERLDFAMARAWLGTFEGDAPELHHSLRYVHTWRTVGERSQRAVQLASVMALGQQLGQLARTPGLRLMLKMMRGPAAAAGLSDLQRFLEAGFDAFAFIARQPSGVQDFLAAIQARESAFIGNLFDAPATEAAQLIP
jgi:hypothetical protein